MARKQIFVSDMSGEEIEEGKGATVTVRVHDARKGQATLDVTDKEAEALAVQGTKTARRGRKPKEQAAPVAA